MLFPFLARITSVFGSEFRLSVGLGIYMPVRRLHHEVLRSPRNYEHARRPYPKGKGLSRGPAK